MRFTSLSIDISLRLAICLPWWALMVQKEQPPKHPRWVLTLQRIISKAGMGPRLRYLGCGSLM